MVEVFCSMWVNALVPKEFDKIEAIDCLAALQLGNNNELFVHYTDKSIRHLNSNLCVGFDKENNLVLRKCVDNNPTYFVEMNYDGTFSFQGYRDKIIFFDSKRKVSENLCNEATEIIVTSEADSHAYKKENILSMLIYVIT